MSGIPTLDTPRLRLRPYHASDFEAYAAMWAEPAVVRFVGTGVPVTREVAWTRFLRHAGHWSTLGFGYLAIEERASGATLGECGFQDLHRALEPSIEGSLEAGWVLSTAAHGRGFAAEAMGAALAWADARFPLRRQTCIIRPDHAASLHIAGTLGFVPYAQADYAGSPITLLERHRPLR